MARKAERGEMTHLLIDRFRFDSFAPDSDEAGSNLLTRFGHDVYLFFMITPPEMLVERAWKRGLEIGRYKAVDDTLAHGIVAYAGMPRLLFTWAKRNDKRVQFELLDNSVGAGERPRTVAFGSNRTLNVLDVKMHDRRRALPEGERRRDRSGGAVSRAGPSAARAQRGLPEAVPRALPRDQLRGPGDGPGLPRHRRRARRCGPIATRSEIAVANPETRAGLAAVVPSALDRSLPSADAPRYLRAIGDPRLGRGGLVHWVRWGSSRGDDG